MSHMIDLFFLSYCNTYLPAFGVAIVASFYGTCTEGLYAPENMCSAGSCPWQKIIWTLLYQHKMFDSLDLQLTSCCRGVDVTMVR
jgi:hypothetical protein